MALMKVNIYNDGDSNDTIEVHVNSNLIMAVGRGPTGDEHALLIMCDSTKIVIEDSVEKFLARFPQV
jgi:hypothetical protein